MSSLLEKFNYDLPASAIAHEPATPRDSAKLLVIDRKKNSFFHHRFYELPDLLDPQSVLVLNDTKVYPARIFGKKPTGGKVELLLVKKLAGNTWEALSTPGLPIGTVVDCGLFTMRVLERKDRVLTVEPNISEHELFQRLEQTGSVPTPPYIKTKLPRQELKERYQTVYAQETGSAAAPTAGLHFTKDVFDKLHQKGIDVISLTLHVGLGTFAPVDEHHLKEKKLHTETYEVTEEEANKINAAKKAGKKIIAVGTTSARTLESVANSDGSIRAGAGETSLFIYPGYQFKAIDGLITNFHVPNSSLLMLVSALCSFPNTSEHFTDFEHNLMGRAYTEALQHHYRFFSFGDSSFIK